MNDNFFRPFLTTLCLLVAITIILSSWIHGSRVERLYIVRHHCPVIDEATGTFKCANGKVYALGDE